jgi:hypothetical protein
MVKKSRRRVHLYFFTVPPISYLEGSRSVHRWMAWMKGTMDLTDQVGASMDGVIGVDERTNGSDEQTNGSDDCLKNTYMDRLAGGWDTSRSYM